MRYAADEWRTDNPPFGKRPVYQYVLLQGSCHHDGRDWFRQGWGTAGIRPHSDPEALHGYRRSDVERIAKDYDIDIETVRVVGWLPACPPAPFREEPRDAVPPSDDGEWTRKPEQTA